LRNILFHHPGGADSHSLPRATTPDRHLYNRETNSWQTIRTPNFPSRPPTTPTAILPVPSRAAVPPLCSPSILKRRCAAVISTTPCPSLSDVPSPTSATASSPSIGASFTACRRWASSSTRSTPSPPRSSATSWVTTTPTATPPSTTSGRRPGQLRLHRRRRRRCHAVHRIPSHPPRR